MPNMQEIKNLRSQLSWLRPFVFFAVACLAVTSLARFGYVLWLDQRVEATDGFGFILLQGLRFDLVTLGYLLAIPVAITPVASGIPAIARIWLPAMKWFLVTMFGLFVFMEVATPAFISEYDVRPNFLFVEYLKYPREVFSMLFVGYKVEILAALVLVPALVWPVFVGINRRMAAVRRTSAWLAIPMGLAGLILCGMAARSTLDHRPVNPSTVAFSSDTLVNSLPLNSLFSMTYAIYEMRHEDSGFEYVDTDARDAIAAARESTYLPPDSFVSNQIPTLHSQAPLVKAERPQNLVIVVEESLGAEFVGSLGGLPLTPNLDALADEGIWFENLYATGTRSARGLEAIVTGFPPTTSQSVLKLGRAQKDFFTIGEFLRRRGYDTSFIYGGEAQFDNMRRFFANNGFETVLDKHDFENPEFFGSWGVCDEDVFDYAHEYFMALDPDRPFVSVLFTTSNHTPWEFPDGRIELYEQPKATRNNSVKYADFALGEFIRKARTADYWNNTVFLIVSDHNSRVYGSELVPIERFHIPGLILGGSIEPQRWSRVASQIDLVPTLLSLIGVDGEHPAIGIDLTRPDIDEIPGRAVLQFGSIQAYLQDNDVVVLRRGESPAVFRYVNHEMIAAQRREALIDKAVALAAWPVVAYREQQYHLPP